MRLLPAEEVDQAGLDQRGRSRSTSDQRIPSGTQVCKAEHRYERDSKRGCCPLQYIHCRLTHFFFTLPLIGFAALLGSAFPRDVRLDVEEPLENLLFSEGLAPLDFAYEGM